MSEPFRRRPTVAAWLPHPHLPFGGVSAACSDHGDSQRSLQLRSLRPTSYGWPLKPFDRQHPVRGFFGDPRIGESADGHVESKTFHFGIDISAPDGTAVYATASGRIVWEPERPETIAIRAADGTVFAYWHIIPTVRNGQQAVAYRTLLGHIAKGWGHVHLAELVAGRYVNPLRRGATDAVRGHDAADDPHAQLRARGSQRRAQPVCAAGSTSSPRPGTTTPMTVPGRWADRPVMPAIVRWRARRQAQRQLAVANGTRLLGHDPGAEPVRLGVRTLDAAEPPVA